MFYLVSVIGDFTITAGVGSHNKLGGGYLLGLPVGFIADSIGATVGAAVAFLLGRTIGRSFVVSKLNDYPQFQAVAIATQKSGFMFLMILVSLIDSLSASIIPFNMLNYALSVTPIPLGNYILASWLGKMPVTRALVYIGTTLKDHADVMHGWHDFSKAHWIRAMSPALIIAGLVVSGCIFAGVCWVSALLSWFSISRSVLLHATALSNGGLLLTHLMLLLLHVVGLLEGSNVDQGSFNGWGFFVVVLVSNMHQVKYCTRMALRSNATDLLRCCSATDLLLLGYPPAAILLC
ncbi:TVP38/TMEM64 family membrane protein slr0305 [Camellia lanceoleosa]|uniref:TVP38/TMEM64 family membrane protein slr0305 n=1 Tax=Camellia lanceoleosa TaxID=1840588 RepID=A0ACC0FMN7_9ERIC|nr:TVP38/TMEM64 family membrane protein slr0305 [Camellia lanceoleosa]